MKNKIKFTLWTLSLCLLAFQSQAEQLDACVVKTDDKIAYEQYYSDSIRAVFHELSENNNGSAKCPYDFSLRDTGTGQGFIPDYPTGKFPEKWVKYNTNLIPDNKIVFKKDLKIDVKFFTLLGNKSEFAAQDVPATSLKTNLVNINNSTREKAENGGNIFSQNAIDVLNNAHSPEPTVLDFRTNFSDLDFNKDDANSNVADKLSKIDWEKFPLQCAENSKEVALWNTIILLPDNFSATNRNNSYALKKHIFDHARKETGCLRDFGAVYVCVGTQKISNGKPVNPNTVYQGTGQGLDLYEQNDAWCEATFEPFTFPKAKPGLEIPNLPNPSDKIPSVEAKIYWPDSDADTYGEEGAGQIFLPKNVPAGYVERGGDCNDADATINPGMTEICGNTVDENCDEIIDDCSGTYYDDADGDGHGDPTTADNTQDAGDVLIGDDCNDQSSAMFPGNVEICDALDNDCNGIVDDLGNGNNCGVYYTDADGDGFGDDSTAHTTYTPGDAVVGGDCNDADASVHPTATEVCGDNIDQDCNGVDTACGQFYDDVDGDGFGDDATEHDTQDGNDVTLGGDCDDANAQINPSANEICANNVDENCDGLIDESCSVEVCTDGLDNDGDSLADCSDAEECDCLDRDEDTFTVVEGDCNDNNPAVHPGATEICNFDNIDFDCDGEVNDDNICIGPAQSGNSVDGWVWADGGTFFGCSLNTTSQEKQGDHYLGLMMFVFGILWLRWRRHLA